MSNRAKLFIPAAFFVAMMGLLSYGLFQDPSHVPSALMDRPLPVFSLPALSDETTLISSAELKGGIYLINFWATSCAPCMIEHPFLLEISEREKDITLVGVNFWETNADDAREFLKERGNPYKISLSDKHSKLGLDFGVTGEPETYVVDKTGTIRYKHIGEIDNTKWQEIFVPILKQLRQ